MEVVLSGIWWLMRLGSSSAGPSGLVRVKLGDHFTKLLCNQKRGGERHERSPFGRPGFRVAGVPPKAAEFEDGRGSGDAARKLYKLAYD
jgi:hypothetical protein